MHIILGGTSGLGLGVADALRSSDERVLVVGRFYNAEQHGEGFDLDLYDRNSVDWATDELAKRLGDEELESFVWSAGYIYRGGFADQPDVRSMAEVNFAGALPLVQWAWKKMLQQNSGGKMVVVSSTSGTKPRADEAVYAATKHAMVGFTRSLGLEAEEREEDVQVLLCLPGATKTPLWNGHEPVDYATFNDLEKVVGKMVRAMREQTTTYAELSMPHGTLV